MKNKLSPLALLWLFNLVLLASYTIGLPGLSFLKSSVLEYGDIKSDAFDGATSPIAYVPDWMKVKNTNKSRNFSDFTVNDFIEIPEYDLSVLADDTQKNIASILARYTYITVYMGSYRGNYLEYDGSHGAVDIRAPLGTPILAVANAVVIKVKDTETGDGKYVILRHDNVDIDGHKETLYSSYEHVSEIDVTEGSKVRRGDVIAKVGMTGITTTPHLHFQIDKSTAPFHTFWPYTFKEAADLGLDFFGAINVGLGKEKMIRYTVNPMEFIKNHRFFASAPPERTIAVATTQNSIIRSTELVTDMTNTPAIPVVQPVSSSAPDIESKPAPLIIEKVAVPNATPAPVATVIEPVKKVLDPAHPFSDIPESSSFFLATKYLADKNVTHGYDDGTFQANALLTRSEAILLYVRLFGIDPTESAEWEFSDVLPSDEVYPYLASAIQEGILTKNMYFRPNDTLTRAEAITLLIRIAKLPLDTSTKSAFRDVKTSSVHMPYINTFAAYLSLRGVNFEPNKAVTRGALAKILFTFDQKKK